MLNACITIFKRNFYCFFIQSLYAETIIIKLTRMHRLCIFYAVQLICIRRFCRWIKRTLKSKHKVVCLHCIAV